MYIGVIDSIIIYRLPEGGVEARGWGMVPKASGRWTLALIVLSCKCNESNELSTFVLSAKVNTYRHDLYIDHQTQEGIQT